MFDTYKMQEHICAELDKKAESGVKSTTDLDTVWKLTDVYKNLLKIDMLQEAAEEGENHYSNYGGGYSERRGRKRDSMGRYSSRGGMSYDDDMSYARGGNRGYSREGGYSRDDGKHYMMGELERLMEKASTHTEREALEKCMQALERA